MESFNVTEYNRLCAEFLGWVVKERDWHFVPDGVSSNIYWYDKSKEDDEGFSTFECWICPENNLRLFSSDWNWIMEVKDAIVKLGTYDHFPAGMRATNRPIFTIEERQIEIYYHDRAIAYKDGVHIVVNTKGYGYKHPMYGNNIFTKNPFNSQKKAVVEAIWTWLNWYSNYKKSNNGK